MKHEDGQLGHAYTTLPLCVHVMHFDQSTQNEHHPM